MDRPPGNYTGLVRIWDVDSLQELLTLRGHAQLVNRISFSPDGQRVATASIDRTVKIWDALIGQEMLTLKDGENVNAVYFSRDGRRLFTASTVSPNTPAPPVGWENRSRYSVKVWDATEQPEKSEIVDTHARGDSSKNAGERE
jgi:WD40 repeat protein